MKYFNPDLLAQWTGGQWTHLPTTPIENFCFDTRKLGTNECFLALKSTKNDGHAYVSQAQKMGAVAALVEQVCDNDLPQLVVPNTLLAFQKIAAHYRQTLSLPICAVTGSCGKTSAKEWLALLLEQETTFKTPENFNNDLGVPYSLTRIDPHQHTRAVLEVGISQVGEMERLGALIKPNNSLLLNVGPAHLGNFSGGLDQLRAEKMALFRFTQDAIFVPFHLIPYVSNTDDLPIYAWLRLKEGNGLPKIAPHVRLLTYTADEKEEGWQIYVRWAEGNYTLNFPFQLGEGALETFIGALYVALIAKIPVELLQQRIYQWKPAPYRGEWLHCQQKHYFVDCYNANPSSFADSLQRFQKEVPTSSSRCFVLGSMAELGEQSSLYHKKVAQIIQVHATDTFILIGEFAEALKEGLLEIGAMENQIEIFKNAVLALAHFRQSPASHFFLKGSHCYHLESLLPNLQS